MLKKISLGRVSFLRWRRRRLSKLKTRPVIHDVTNFGSWSPKLKNKECLLFRERTSRRSPRCWGAQILVLGWLSTRSATHDTVDNSHVHVRRICLRHRPTSQSRIIDAPMTIAAPIRLQGRIPAIQSGRNLPWLRCSIPTTKVCRPRSLGDRRRLLGLPREMLK
jgi:hypothetical protein